MAPLHGCDTDQLAAYSDQLRSAALAVAQTSSLVGTLAARTDVWVGQDAEALRDTLASVLMPSLIGTEERLRSPDRAGLAREYTLYGSQDRTRSGP